MGTGCQNFLVRRRMRKKGRLHHFPLSHGKPFFSMVTLLRRAWEKMVIGIKADAPTNAR